jgi:hypothetical protein
VCHHDFSKCFLEKTHFPKNVHFIDPHLVTSWGDISVCLAALKAFGVLMERHNPDWIILLSGSDYPVRRAEDIHHHLSKSEFDVLLDYREIQHNLALANPAIQVGFGRPDWIRLAYTRYCGTRFWWPRPSRELLIGGILPFRRSYFAVSSPGIDSVLQRVQFLRPSRIFGGDFWFQANRKAISALLNYKSLGRLVRYYRRREIPEESLFHTVFCNDPSLRVCTSHLRYANWNGNGAHPKWLGIADLPDVAASGAHFARKFRPDGVAQDRIDQTILAAS